MDARSEHYIMNMYSTTVLPRVHVHQQTYNNNLGGDLRLQVLKCSLIPKPIAACWRLF